MLTGMDDDLIDLVVRVSEIMILDSPTNWSGLDELWAGANYCYDFHIETFEKSLLLSNFYVRLIPLKWDSKYSMYVCLPRGPRGNTGTRPADRTGVVARSEASALYLRLPPLKVRDLRLDLEQN